jgi:SlyX protein
MDEQKEEIVELQTRLQFQDDVINKLDEVVIRQGRELERMARRLAALEERVDRVAFERDKIQGQADEKPPHY